LPRFVPGSDVRKEDSVAGYDLILRGEHTMPRAFWIPTVLALAITTASFAADPPRHVAVRAGRLLDATDAAPIRNAVILIEGDRITAVGAGLAIPAGYEVVDL